MATNLSKKGDLDRLEPRREPYWGIEPVVQYVYVGYRAFKKGGGSWIARYREPGKEQYTHRLGRLTKGFGYTEAKEKARSWYEKDILQGVSSKPPTVSEACQEYLDDVREDASRKDPEASYRDARWRIRKYVDAEPIGAIRLDRLREPDVRKWWRNLGGSKASQNRNLAVLHAALNLAVRNRRVGAERTIEWQSIKKHRNPGQRRDVYLSVEDRHAILEACDDGFRDFVEAAVLTGARPGDLARVRRRDFDGRNITFSSKTDAAEVPLSADAQKLFRRLAKGKLPAAYLLVRDEEGKPYGRIDWSRRFRAACLKAAEAKKLKKSVAEKAVMYSCRHSWITDALTAKMPAIEVAKVARTSIAMLERNYWKLIRANLEDRLNSVKML